jgi:hypothetical protein
MWTDRRSRDLAAGLAAALAGLAVCLGPAVPAASALPDGRGWEMVSPVDKNGGRVEPPGPIPGDSLIQAASDGDSISFSSAASFGTDPQGAPPPSQYIATRSGDGWSTENVSPPLLSGTYRGNPHLAFSDDLTRALVSGGWNCRGEAESCEAENPPLGPGGPAGYRNLYLHENGSYTPLITTANAPALTVSAEDFQLAFGGASPDLRHAAISTCAALTPAATEVPGPEGCDPAAQNLYLWSAGQLRPINFLPGQAATDPGAALAARRGAVSAGGERAYWRGADGNLYLREASETSQVDAAAGGGGQFEAASADGTIAFFTKAGHLWRAVAGGSAADLTPGGGVSAVLGASPGATRLFYLVGPDLFLWRQGAAAEQIAAAADLSDVDPETSGVADGGRRLFFSTATPLEPTDTNSDSDVYQWGTQGSGDCAAPGGCLDLISSGRATNGAVFAVAGASGDDAFFLTERSLVGSDPGSMDLYDARVGGGFPQPSPPIPCQGDACQHLPPEPVDPTLTTLLSGLGNPRVRFRGATRDCRPIFRNARRLARRSKRLGRRARGLGRRPANARQVRRLRARAAKLAERRKRTARAAKRCRRSNRKAAVR